MGDKLKEKYCYFPFTHGDEIEKRRVYQKESLKNELKDKMSQSVNGGSASKQSGRYSNGNSSTFHAMPSVNGKVPVNFVTSYPLFLKPDKHYPYRRLNDTHVESVMQDALKRYEKDLRSQEE